MARETNAQGVWTPLAPSEDQANIEVDWGNYQVSPIPAAPRRPSVAAPRSPVQEPASRFARVIAVLFDALLLMLPWAVSLIVLRDTLDQPETETHRVAWVLLGTLAVWVGQMTLLALRGQTLGKMAVGVRVVRAVDGSNPGFWRAVVLRQLAPSVIGSLPIVGLFFFVMELLTFLGEDRRCVHDYLADTKVVEA